MSDDTLIRLAATIAARRSATANASYTKSLLDKGAAACAKKLGEEAVETIIAGVGESDEKLCAEAADLLYHLLVLLEIAKRAAGSRVERARSKDDTIRSCREGLAGIRRKRDMSLQSQVLDFEPRQTLELSPYRTFTRAEWSELRNGVQLTLSDEDLARLSGLIERISHDEVTDIYLPISKLVNYYVRAAQLLHSATTRFFHQGEEKVPFIIGIAGSVAVGKSTSARVLRELLARWPNHPRVDLVPTDGFLLPNVQLERRGIMHRKGFPESFDQARLLQFVADVKAGKSNVEAPVYSHFSYDIVRGETIVVDRPDILIVEGLNVLQPAKLPQSGDAVPFVSDFFDFSIYIDAEPAVIEKWYVTRFLRLYRTAFRDKDAYFYRYSKLTEEQAVAQALKLWRTINLLNLKKNILPTRKRANLILSKGEAHRVETVALRKL